MNQPTGRTRRLITHLCGLVLAVSLLGGSVFGHSASARAAAPAGPALQACLTISECPDTARVTLWDLQARRKTHLLATPGRPGFRAP
jgi:hypothetical protein